MWETAFPAQAHDEAWRVERTVRERADGPFQFRAGFEL
jgi:hypothetical protein